MIMMSSLEHVVLAFLLILHEHELYEDANPHRVHLHPLGRNRFAVQYYDQWGVQQAEGTYTGTAEAGTVLLEWAETPCGKQTNGRSFCLAYDESKASLSIVGEPAMA